MIKTPSPSRANALDTSPPLCGGEDGREPSKPGSRPLAPTGGEVSRALARDGEGGSEPSRSRRTSGATERARAMRRDGTKAEALLWIELKAKRLGGFRFVRQLPIGKYIADFACRSKKLIVEVDGSQHADSKRDRRRDSFLRSQGWSTIRFWNDDVLRHRTSVCETILAVLDGSLSETVDSSDFRFAYSPSAAWSVSKIVGKYP